MKRRDREGRGSCADGEVCTDPVIRKEKNS
jgi:hypothetical protein